MKRFFSHFLYGGCLLLLTYSFYGCTTKSASDVQPLVQPAADPLPAAMKGYMLYSWQSDSKWHFSLLPGTNFVPPYESITTPGSQQFPIITHDVASLLALLDRLPAKQTLGWNPSYVKGNFSFPDAQVVEQVTAFCKKKEITLLN